MGDHFGAHVKEAAEVLDTLGERPERLVVLQVADVVRHECAPALGEAEGVFQFGAAGQHRAAHVPGQEQRLGHVPPGPA